MEKLPAGAATTTDAPMFNEEAVTTQGNKQVRRTAVSFITIYDPSFVTNLGRSSLWRNRKSLPHEWILLDNKKNQGISSLYAAASAAVQHDLQIFLHPDVFLPDGFLGNLFQKILILEKVDPNWGVIGSAGVPAWWTPWVGTLDDRIASSIRDFNGQYNTGRDSLRLQSLDESLLVLRRSAAVKFDANLPGFDFYGTDICLTASRNGRQSYLLNVRIDHKLRDATGKPVNWELWLSKIESDWYQLRVMQTEAYMKQKWCSTGLLPVYGTAFNLTCSW
jgi:hypothetical protein